MFILYYFKWYKNNRTQKYLKLPEWQKIALLTIFWKEVTSRLAIKILYLKDSASCAEKLYQQPMQTKQSNSRYRNIYEACFDAHNFATDLTALSTGDADLPYQWISALLQSKPFKAHFKADFSQNLLFRHWYFSARNAERAMGARVLALGFPIVTLRSEAGWLAAPLLLWNFQMEPDPDRTEAWNISRQTDLPVYANLQLARHIDQNHRLDFETELLDLQKSGIANPGTLTAWVSKWAEKLGWELENQTIAIAPWPKSEELDKNSCEGAVYWSAALGVFPPQEYYPLEFPETKTAATGSSDWGHPFGLPELDPWQSNALQMLRTQRNTLIEGIAGTGKTHLLTHLLIQALSNGKNCLVVSESVPSLQQIQTLFGQQAFASFSFLLRDAYYDKNLLLELLRVIGQAERTETRHRKDAFRQTLDKLTLEKMKMDQQYGAVRRKVFGESNWSEIVGRFLRINRVEGKELLSSQLNPQEFQFQEKEFQETMEAIEKSLPLFHRINTMNHPLRNLNAGIFIHYDKEESIEFIERQTKELLEKASKVHHRFILKQNEYADRLLDFYEQHYRELLEKTEALGDRLREADRRFGMELLRSGKSTLRLYGVFSEKHRQMLELKEAIALASTAMEQTHREHRFFEFNFEAGALADEQLAAFLKALERWRDSLPSVIQDELLRLSAKTALPELEMNEQIEELETTLELLTEEINESGLYQLPLENKRLTISKRQRFLEELMEQLEATRFSLKDFGLFYDWQRNWFQMPEASRRVLKALAKVRPSNWQAAFESWYLNNCLSNTFQPALPTKEPPLKDYALQYRLLENLMLPQIADLWQEKREQALQALKRNGERSRNSAYDTCFGKNNAELCKDKSLEDVFRLALPTIARTLPVLLVTPRIAQAMLRTAGSGVFDVVCMEEGYRISAREGEALARLGNRVAVFTDPSLAISGSGDFATQFAENGARVAALRICHRWRPGSLLPLSGNVEWSDKALQECSVHYEQLDGRYQVGQAVNEEEAQQVIRLLNQVKETPQRTFPTVGIACFTLQQRDLIADYLLQIKRKDLPGADKIKQMERNGLGVFHLSELYGLQFDILFVSSVFGISDVKGNLPDDADWLETPESHSLVNLLQGCVLKDLFILNSIPKVDLSRRLNLPEKTGWSAWAHYCAYAEAFQAADMAAQQAIIDGYRNVHRAEIYPYPDSIFAAEVARELTPYLGAGRIQVNVREAHRFFPVLIQAARAGEPNVCILPDCFHTHSPTTDLLWEYEQTRILAQQGYRFLPVWSVKWWKNPTLEARKVASLILKFDAEGIDDDEEGALGEELDHEPKAGNE